jgi:phosphatidylserine decarboxylase
VALWVAYFFRDPERTGARGDQLIIAPADGKVVMITEVDEPTFVHGRAKRVSIFMNVFNVHREPVSVSGTVKYVHKNGQIPRAAAEESSLENEQISWDSRPAGAHSRASDCRPHRAANFTYSREGERVEQGERMGIIRFGSRVRVRSSGVQSGGRGRPAHRRRHNRPRGAPSEMKRRAFARPGSPAGGGAAA